MKFQERGVVFAVGLLVVLVMLACRTTDTLIAQAPTATLTRTPKPTFTPQPPPTDTPIPPPPTLPPASPVPTQKPAPTRTATRRPNTPAPPPATPIPGPTKSSWVYRVDKIVCKHSGQSFVEGLVLANSDTSSGISGTKVRMSADPNGAPAGPDYETRDGGGFGAGYFSFIVNAYGAAKGQVRYLWVVDGSGKALSDPSAGRAAFNDEPGDENPNSCWDIQILFIQN